MTRMRNREREGFAKLVAIREDVWDFNCCSSKTLQGSLRELVGIASGGTRPEAP